MAYLKHTIFGYQSILFKKNLTPVVERILGRFAHFRYYEEAKDAKNCEFWLFFLVIIQVKRNEQKSLSLLILFVFRQTKQNKHVPGYK